MAHRRQADRMTCSPMCVRVSLTVMCIISSSWFVIQVTLSVLVRWCFPLTSTCSRKGSNLLALGDEGAHGAC